MKRETITISLPPAMRRFVDERSAAEFNSVSEYVRFLINRDRQFFRSRAATLREQKRREAAAAVAGSIRGGGRGET